MRLLQLALLSALLFSAPVMAEDGRQDYLYYRDASVPPFQKSREFFDMPDRPGRYEITLVSDAVGPLTFQVSRVEDDVETLIRQYRSYSVDNHEFNMVFNNEKGTFDLIVEIANSNPVSRASVSVIVVEEP